VLNRSVFIPVICWSCLKQSVPVVWLVNKFRIVGDPASIVFDALFFLHHVLVRRFQRKLVFFTFPVHRSFADPQTFLEYN
jgi:hypothetical protein